MLSNKLNYKLINLMALMLLFYISISNIKIWINIIKIISSTLMPFFVAFTLAYASTPVINYLKKKRLNKTFSILIIVCTTIMIIISLFTIIIPIIYDQLIILSKPIMNIVNMSNNINLEIEDYLNNIINYLGNILSKGIIIVFNKSIDLIGKTIISFISWIYFLYYMDNIRECIKLFSKKISNNFYKYIKTLDLEISNYIKGISLVMLIQLIEYSILFKLIDHPNWLILAILAAITTPIPCIGGLLTNIIAIIISSFISTKLLIGTMIICIVFSQVDAYIISPKIYGKTNNINPLLMIILISIGGALGNIIGIIISLPLFILIKATYNYYYSDLKRKYNIIKNN